MNEKFNYQNYYKKYYGEHKEEMMQANKKWRKNNLELYKELKTENNKKYIERHREEKRAKDKKYYEEHREEILKKIAEKRRQKKNGRFNNGETKGN